MPEVNISGPAGRIEARYHHERGPNAPVALILHPHPQFGGTMNNQVVYHLYYAFQKRGFSVLALQLPGRRPERGPVRQRARRARRRRHRARLAAGLQCRRPDLLDRRRLVRRLDRHAAPDAAPRARGLHLGGAPRQSLRLHLPRPLPLFGPDGQRGERSSRANGIRARARGPSQDAEGHRDRPLDRAGRQPLLRGPHGRADGGGRRLSRQAPRQGEEAQRSAA